MRYLGPLAIVAAAAAAISRDIAAPERGSEQNPFPIAPLPDLERLERSKWRAANWTSYRRFDRDRDEFESTVRATQGNKVPRRYLHRAARERGDGLPDNARFEYGKGWIA